MCIFFFFFFPFFFFFFVFYFFFNDTATTEIYTLSLHDALPISKSVAKRLVREGIRVETDFRNEKIGFKIRESRLEKVPYMLVIGEREAESGAVAVRHREDGDRGALPLEDFIELVRDEISSPVLP